MELRKGFVCPAKAGEVMGAIGMEMKNGKPGVLELYCISGGPVFLVIGKVNGGDAYPLVHKAAGQTDLRFEAMAVANANGVVGCCLIPENPGPITVLSDVESVGLVRITEVC